MNQKKENGPLGKQSIYFHDAPHLLSGQALPEKRKEKDRSENILIRSLRMPLLGRTHGRKAKANL